MRMVLLVVVATSLSATSLFVPSRPFAGSPFSTPYIAVADVARIACAIAGVVALLLLIKLAVNAEHRDFPRATAFGTMMGAFLLVSAVFTELSVLGSRPTLRLVFNTCGCVFGLLYVRELLGTPRAESKIKDVNWPSEE